MFPFKNPPCPGEPSPQVTRFLDSTRAHMPNRTSTGSALFGGRTVVANRNTDNGTWVITVGRILCFCIAMWPNNKAVIDRRLRPRCCHLGSYFKRPKSSTGRPLACNWYYCAQSIAKPKAACALRFSWAATSSNFGL